jgi:hypothetical protein
MSKRIQSRVFAFDEVEFLAKPGTRTIVLKVIRFAIIIIVKFDPTTEEVGDIAIGITRILFHEPMNDEHVNVNK